jgi:hypothetical protein
LIRDELAATLDDEEKAKLDSFLQRLTRLHVVRSGESLGEYGFKIRLYQVYLTMKLRRPSRREGGPRHG